jgi:hypothetical protein
MDVERVIRTSLSIHNSSPRRREGHEMIDAYIWDRINERT